MDINGYQWILMDIMAYEWNMSVNISGILVDFSGI